MHGTDNYLQDYAVSYPRRSRWKM